MLNTEEQRREQRYLNIAGNIQLAKKIYLLAKNIVQGSCCPEINQEKIFVLGVCNRIYVSKSGSR